MTTKPCYFWGSWWPGWVTAGSTVSPIPAIWDGWKDTSQGICFIHKSNRDIPQCSSSLLFQLKVPNLPSAWGDSKTVERGTPGFPHPLLFPAHSLTESSPSLITFPPFLSPPSELAWETLSLCCCRPLASRPVPWGSWPLHWEGWGTLTSHSLSSDTALKNMYSLPIHLCSQQHYTYPLSSWCYLFTITQFP